MQVLHIREQDGVSINHSAVDFSTVVSRLIAEASDNTIIEFEPGVYHFWPELAAKRTLYISNTDSSDFPEKNIGILAEDKKNLILRGRSASLIFHGNILALAFLRCSGIRLEGLQIDYACPSTIDATITRIVEEEGKSVADVRVPSVYTVSAVGSEIQWESESSPYTGKPYWTGSNGLVLSQHFRKQTGFLRRTGEDLFYHCIKTEKLQEHSIRLHYDIRRDMAEGDMFQMRNTIRDACGLFFSECREVSLESLEIDYMYGIGIVCQCTDTLEIGNVRFSTLKEGRMTASAADFIQVSGCRGKVHIHGCTFVSPHDDPINIHGTFMEAMQAGERHWLMKYAHPQTLGFASAYPGDFLQLYDADSLLPFGEPLQVLEAAGPDLQNPTVMQITVDKEIVLPTGMKAVVENITWTPEVFIERNLFEAVPTRGVLVSTRGRVIIRENIFSHIEMAAIFISGDANSWYESGPVTDVRIENNRFMDCGAHALLVEPTNTVLNGQKKVHSKIRLTGNQMFHLPLPVASFKSTGDAQVDRNLVECVAGMANTPLVEQICSDVLERDNTVRTVNGCFHPQEYLPTEP